MQKLNLDDSQPKTVASTPEPVQPLVDEKELTEQNLNVNLTQQESTGRKDDMALKPKKIGKILAVVIIIAGIASGYGANKLRAKMAGSKTPDQQVAGEVEAIKAGDVFGVQDAETFKDTAEGYLKKGEADSEGSHSLIRPGGDSQTVSLTSSVTDLDKFIGMQIKVSGETFKGQKAGWLMDVGRVEVLDPKAEEPVEE